MSAGYHRLGPKRATEIGYTAKRLWGVDLPVLEPIADVMPHSTAPKLADTFTEARSKGYTGDECSSCGSMQMRRNGTCLVCDACGQTTGCS